MEGPVGKLGNLMKAPLFCSLLFLPLATLEANNVGNWDLSSWGSVGNNYLSATIQSDGSKPVGLTTNLTSPTLYIIEGEADGTTTTVKPWSVPPNATSSYKYSQNFTFSSPVDFGATSRQSQFSSATANGFGLRITTQNPEFVDAYHITIQLVGGGVFTAFNGTPDGFGPPAGIGTKTVEIQWTNPSPPTGTATFGGIAITGPVTGIHMEVSATYENDESITLNPTNLVEVKLNNGPHVPFAPTVRISGRETIRTSSKSVRIRGTAADRDGNLARVEVKAGNLPFTRAKGTFSWSYTLRKLKPGKNTILVRAVDSTGRKSRVTRIRVIRS